MIRTATTLALIAAALSPARQQTRPEATRSVSWDDLGTKVQIIGCCGKPMGSLITVEGELIDPAAIRSKLDSSATLFKVDRIDGKAPSQPTQLRISENSWDPGESALKRRYRLIGWETGGFIGLPEEGSAFMLEHDIPFPATTGWTFFPQFNVLKAVEIP